MGSEQRIIGGGLLFIGIIVVVILLFVFNFSGMSPQEGYEKVLNDLYPEYQTAVQRDDYLEQTDVAKRIQAVFEDAGQRAVMKFVQGEAGSGNQDAQALAKLVESNAFAENAANRYGFEGGYYRQTTHIALKGLRAAIDELKMLRGIRDAATAARAGLADARIGSGMALPLPEAKLVPKDDAPIVSPNPVYVHDAELYRAFGVKPADLRTALQTPASGAGKATSARLRWNQQVADSGLAAKVAAVAAQADRLRQLSVSVRRHATNAAEDETAAKALAAELTRAATYVGSGLTGDHAAAFNEHKAKFTDGVAISTVLDREAAMLLAYTGYGELGPLFGAKFPE